MKKLSRKQQEVEARRAADPIAQAVGRDDIDYSTDELPAAPRDTVNKVMERIDTDLDRAMEVYRNPRSRTELHHGVERQIPIEPQTDEQMLHGKIVSWQREAKYPASVLDDLLAAGEINREQYERLRRENKQ